MEFNNVFKEINSTEMKGWLVKAVCCIAPIFIFYKEFA